LNLGAITGALQGVGDAGSQFAEGKLNAQAAKLKALLDSLKVQEGTVNLDETKERLRRLKLQPDTKESDLQQQIDAAEKVLKRKLTDSEKQIFVLGIQGKQGPQNTGSVKERLEQGLAALPDEQRKVVEPAIRAYMDAGEYDKAMQVFSSVAEKFQSEPKHAPAVLRSKGGTPYGMRVGNKDIVPGSPEWNEGYQKVLDAEVKATEKDAAEKRKIEEAKRRAALSKELRGQTSRQMENTFRDYDAATKILAPFDRIADVANRAQEYVQAPSGPGDVALMLAYVEATKPQTGFRFTTAEQNMIKTSRGWVEGAQAKVQGGYTGVLFGDEQRKIIGNIIESAGDAVEERKNTYLRGILRINPKLYNILTGTPDGGPTPPPPPPPGTVPMENQ
jgi:tetratricopeptide (TPR) repeat protein